MGFKWVKPVAANVHEGHQDKDASICRDRLPLQAGTRYSVMMVFYQHLDCVLEMAFMGTLEPVASNV